MANKKISFYDLKKKKKFYSKDYEITTKIVRGHRKKFAIATSPFTGIEIWRVLPKNFK